MSRILVFDSGVGGLSIVETLRQQAPDTVMIDYAADAGFFPYGIKTDAELKERLPRVCAALVDASQPDVLVIACNTASTLALEEIRAQLAIPVVGTVPAIKPAAKLTRTGKIGVLATPGTVRRKYLDDLERDFAKDVEVIRCGSAGLVDLAERSVRGQEIEPQAVMERVVPLFDMPNGHLIDVVVLACTHFPLIREQIRSACPAHVKDVIDTGDAIARQALRVLPPLKMDRKTTSPCVFLTGGRANKDAYAPAVKRFGYTDINIIDV